MPAASNFSCNPILSRVTSLTVMQAVRPSKHSIQTTSTIVFYRINKIFHQHLSHRNHLTLNIHEESYSVAVYLVRLVSSQDLLDQLRRTAVEQQELCRQRVSEKLRSDPENEISTTGLQVSLICPLAKMRMSVPSRARGCAHLQCFDASFYLQMNERKPRWTCPVCHRYAPFDELRIDSLLCDILEKCGEDVEEIEYLSDSSWRAVRHDKSDKNQESVQHQQIKHHGSCSPVGSVIVDLTHFSSDDEDLQKEETVSTHLEDKSVLFRKSGIVKTTKPKSRKTQVQNC